MRITGFTEYMIDREKPCLSYSVSQLKFSEVTMRARIIIGILGIFIALPANLFAQLHDSSKELDSNTFQRVTSSSFPTNYNEWLRNFSEEYKSAFVAVMNEWYRDKSGLSSGEEDEKINRFVNSSKDKPVHCQTPEMWKSASSDRSLVTRICNQNDFHITLVAWIIDTGNLISAHFAGDKARPVSVVGVLNDGQYIELKGEQPPYEGEGTITCLMKWDGKHFVASDWGWKK